MEALALLDAIFLFVETPENPKHVGLVLVFDPAPDAGSDFVADLVGRFRDLEVETPFNRRVEFHAHGMPTWETLGQCDLEEHELEPSGEYVAVDLSRASATSACVTWPVWATVRACTGVSPNVWTRHRDHGSCAMRPPMFKRSLERCRTRAAGRRSDDARPVRAPGRRT